MKPRRPWFVKAAGLLGWLAWPAVAAAAGTAPDTIPPDQLEFFEKHVRPLLVKRCFECHGGTRAEGGLSLATANGWKRGGDSGPAIVPGQPEASLLVEAIAHRSLEMPPADRGGKMPAEEIAILTVRSSQTQVWQMRMELNQHPWCVGLAGIHEASSFRENSRCPPMSVSRRTRPSNRYVSCS